MRRKKAYKLAAAFAAATLFGVATTAIKTKNYDESLLHWSIVKNWPVAGAVALKILRADPNQPQTTGVTFRFPGGETGAETKSFLEMAMEKGELSLAKQLLDSGAFLKANAVVTAALMAGQGDTTALEWFLQ